MADGLEMTSIQWHPGFYGAAEIEFISNKGDLEFQREYNLSKKPLCMDLMIIKKLADVQIENEIGRIFKRYNVVEYKNPTDGLTIDDYYKTIGYACLYKGLGETVDQVPGDELTVSIFREGYPRELFEALSRAGLEIEERFHGIYYIKGKVLFDTQVVVTGLLDREAHRSLRVLSRHAQEEDVRAFLKEAVRFEEPGDRNNIDAILQVSASANRELYEDIRRDSVMCEALRELMKDVIEEEKRQAVEETKKEVEKKAAEEVQNAKRKAAEEVQNAEKKVAEEVQNAVLGNIRNLMENMRLTAEEAMTALNIPVEVRSGYASKL